MRSIKATITAILTIGLLASAACSVVAQEESDPNLEASAFRATAGPPQAILFDPDAGVELVTNADWDATDTRASGLMSTVVARGGMCAGDHRVIDGAVECEPPSYSVSLSGARLVNDGGAWVGTLTVLDTEELDERTRRQRRRGRGKAPINSRGGFFELTGQGAYEGLSLLEEHGEAVPDSLSGRERRVMQPRIGQGHERSATPEEVGEESDPAQILRT